MKKEILYLTTLILMFTGLCRGQNPKQTWRDIVPLHSRKTEVARITNTLKRIDDATFESKEGRISIRYVKERCVNSGWNVGNGTVSEFTFYPQTKTNFQKQKTINLIRTADDAGHTYYTDLVNGLQYMVDDHGLLQYVRHVPKKTDQHLRCNGFPKYNPATEMYQSYDGFAVGDKPDDVYRAVDTLLQLKVMQGYSAYFILYVKKGTSNQVRANLLSDLNRFIFSTSGADPKKTKVIFGGLRDDSEIETFLVPDGYPDPSPSPKYPSV